jgi:hypothetical protein
VDVRRCQPSASRLPPRSARPGRRAAWPAQCGRVSIGVATGQSAGGDPARHRFDRAGQGAHRTASGNDDPQDLVPARQPFRPETVDSQHGEAERRGGKLYFDQWDYRFERQMLPAGNDATSTGGNNFNTTVGETRG